MFGIKNVGARIGELRAEGHAIYLNDSKYRLGTPSRAIVAAGVLVLAGAVGLVAFLKVRPSGETALTDATPSEQPTPPESSGGRARQR